MSSLGERLAAAALAQVGMAEGEVAAARPVYEDRVPDPENRPCSCRCSTPRSAAWSTTSQPSWKPRGRVTLRVGRAGIHLTLESGDGSSFEPLPTRW